MHNFRDFNVWKRGTELVKNIYSATSDFPSEEKFGITSQIRRCAVSIPSNIAEGSGRKTDKDFSNFLSISLGSQYELETQLIVSSSLGFLQEKVLEELLNELNEIQRMTRALIDKFS
ncbi:four helix bundle protein [Ekhidna sp.]|uniref:four helix bundle protein n=1 Tax=Ekhidna sp. TaxID=2608089 RepID=UPI0035135873